MTQAEFRDLITSTIPVNYTQPRQVLDKPRSIKQYISYMLNRTNSMFEYENLPSTIPAYMLELYLQIFGYACFTYIEDTTILTLPKDNYKTPPGHYIFYGSLGGERDIYYRPTTFIVANPRIRNSVNCTIVYDKDHVTSFKNPCVIMKSDTNYMGLLPLFSRYAEQLTENDISIRCAQINARAQTGICASTDRDAEMARKYFDDLEAGKMGVIGDSAFLEGISISNVGTQSANHIIQLIELQQYLKASWYNELGLNVNFNMKREYMSEEEIAVNTDILLPLVDDMYNCRLEAIDLINSTFDLNIKVSKSSAWANKEQEELSALGEQSIKGEMPLSDTIQNRVDATHEVQAATQIQAEIPNQPGSIETETNPVQSTGPADNMGENGQNTQPDTGPVQGPTIQINIDTREATVNADSGTEVNENDNSKSETPSESKESDDN